MITLIIPCYNEQEVLPILYKALCDVAKKMVEETFEFLFVDDGSNALFKLPAILGAGHYACHV